MIISKRYEILFLYDVTNANPNGDPNDENKPRIDEETGLNIVTDVRLKRTIRDYLYSYKGYNGDTDKDIFVRQTASVKGGLNDGKGRAKQFSGKEDILQKCIDVRLFGGVIPLEKDSYTFTGPVQFKMGKSLHRVQLQYIKGTGAFTSKEGDKQNTFREEFILPYSMIAFYGVINENAARHTGLTENDIDELKEAIWEGTKNLITRSKFEHNPRLLVIIKHKEPSTFIGELDKLISITSEKNGESIRDVADYSIVIAPLAQRINEMREKIESIEIRKDERLQIPDIDQLRI